MFLSLRLGLASGLFSSRLPTFPLRHARNMPPPPPPNFIHICHSIKFEVHIYLVHIRTPTSLFQIRKYRLMHKCGMF
jgi:hypothetical protein